MQRKLILPLIVIFAILTQACGSQNFALDLRLALAASGPLIQSLPISQALKDGDIADFTDLASGALTLADDLKVCASARPCELSAVSKYEVTFESVLNRGHLVKSGPKVAQVLAILRGIIEAAKIYFGAPSNARMASKPVTEKSIKAQIATLKTAMQP